MHRKNIQLIATSSFRTKILAILPFILLVCITLGFSVAYSVDLGDGYSSGSGAPPECTVDTVAPPAFVQKIGRSVPASSGPTGMTIDSYGNTYVVDRNNARILKFSSAGTYLTQWGRPGSADDELINPTEIAFSSIDDSLYVVDQDNNRIQKFDLSGNFITKWGSLGNGNGQFSGPYGIAIDTTGNVFVSDTQNNRIQKFDSSGNFITKWGSYGTGNGQFSSPVGVAIDLTGNLYVSEIGNSRIQKLDSSGNFITKWGTQGSGNGQMNEPRGIVADSSNNIYVADSQNNRIQKFDSLGNYVSQWGSIGTNAGNLNQPYDVVFDSTNRLYVVEYGNRRIQRTRPEGTGVFTKLANTGPVELFINDNTDLAVNVSVGGDSYDLSNFGFALPQDAQVSSIYSTYENTSGSWGMGHYANGTLQLRTTSGLVGQAKSITIPLSNRSTTATSSDLWGTSISVADINSSDFGIRLYLEGAYRWVYTDYISLSINITTPADLIWSTDGHYGNGQWNGPSDVVVDADDNIYIADTQNSRIHKLNASGSFVAQIGSEGSGQGQFRGIFSVDFGNNKVYGLDYQGNRVLVFDTDGNYLSSISGGFTSPKAVVVNSNYVYVTDGGNGRIYQFDIDGNAIRYWGSTGIGDGQFNNAQGIALDSTGNVYVADSSNNRIQKFTSDGDYVTQWGSNGPGNGQLTSPRGIAIDASNNVYVSDSGNNRIQKFDSNGNYITQWGSQGTSDGLFNNPAGLTVDSLGNVYVAESSNNRIQKFTYDKVTVSTPDGVTEGGAVQDYTVVLNTAPSSDVTVTLSVSNPASGSSISVSPATLIFTASNWNVPQEVIITPDDDATYTGNRSASISYSMSSVDTSFNCTTLSDTTVSIIENDQLPQATPTSTPQPAPTLEPLIANRLSGGFDANGECIMQRPGGKPDIFRIDMTDTKATLYIAPPSKPYTQFYITYKELGSVAHENGSLNSKLWTLSSLLETTVYAESPEYAIDFTHENDGGVVVYTINELKPNTKYEFTIKCSNKCAFAETGNTLGASTVGTGSSAPKTYLAYNQSTSTQSQLIEYQLVNTGSPAYITIVVGFVLMILGIGVYSLKSIQVHDLSATSSPKFTLESPRIIRYEW